MSACIIVCISLFGSFFLLYQKLFMFYACWTHVNCLQQFTFHFLSVSINSSVGFFFLPSVPYFDFYNGTQFLSNSYLLFFFCNKKRPIKKSLVSILRWRKKEKIRWKDLNWKIHTFNSFRKKWEKRKWNESYICLNFFCAWRVIFCSLTIRTQITFVKKEKRKMKKKKQ